MPKHRAVCVFFAGAAIAVGAVLMASGCGSDTYVVAPAGNAAAEWRVFGGGLQRTSYNPDEHVISRDTVGKLIPRWRFLTGAIVTAAPVVAYVDLPGEGRVKAVFAASWDGNFYAIRAADGTLIWSYAFKPDPGSEFVEGASAAVDDVDGRRVVYVAGGRDDVLPRCGQRRARVGVHRRHRLHRLRPRHRAQRAAVAAPGLQRHDLLRHGRERAEDLQGRLLRARRRHRCAALVLRRADRLDLPARSERPDPTLRRLSFRREPRPSARLPGHARGL